MKSRNLTVVDDDVVSGIATNGEPVFQEIEDKLVTIVEIERQIRHAKSRDWERKILKVSKIEVDGL